MAIQIALDTHLIFLCHPVYFFVFVFPIKLRTYALMQQSNFSACDSWFALVAITNLRKRMFNICTWVCMYEYRMYMWVKKNQTQQNYNSFITLFTGGYWFEMMADRIRKKVAAQQLQLVHWPAQISCTGVN